MSSLITDSGALWAIYGELKGIAPEELTTAEKNIMAILTRHGYCVPPYQKDPRRKS